ncbi:hypothetical protein [Cellulomonas sp.]|uniref:hypothetical protein n=1 Tax=Cellulomonas sp. TaxID=40001 RepID=UPI003BACDD65
MKGLRWIVAGVVAIAVGGVALVACTGDDEPTPTGTGTASSSPAAEGMTREELEAAVFGSDSASTVLGSVEGAVRDPLHPFPARIDVTEVVAAEASTTVRFTLVNLEDTDPLLQLTAFNDQRPLTMDIRDVALVDPTASLRFLPYVGAPNAAGETASICACSTAPLQMSEVGQLLSATFPPLDPSTETVTLEIPGFPPVEGVAVSRP